MEDLEYLYKIKIIKVDSDLIHVEMELDRIKWNSSYIKLLEEELKPVHFFQLQARLERDM